MSYIDWPWYFRNSGGWALPFYSFPKIRLEYVRGERIEKIQGGFGA